MLNERGVSLVSLLVGSTLALMAAGFIGRALTSSSRAISSVAGQKERTLDLLSFTAQLKKDFYRRRPGGFALHSSPAFKAGSACQDLTIEQTVLPSGVRRIEYRTVCDGPPLASENAREDLSRELAAGCTGRPRISVQTTEPDGRVSSRLFPPAQVMDAALVCFQSESGANGTFVLGDMVQATPVRDGRFKGIIKRLRIGIDDAGDGIEIIPPQ